MQNILIVSAAQSHPTNSGSSSRIRNIVELLIDNGFNVTFLYVGDDEVCKKAMSDYWGSRLVLYNPFSEAPTSKDHIKKFLDKFSRKIKFTSYKKKYNQQTVAHNFLIDDFYNDKLSVFLKKLHKEKMFDVVIAEYVILSKALTVFPDSVLKMLDTHDIFTDRFRMFIDKGLSYNWWSFFKEEETIGFDRADYVIGIQKKEAERIGKMTNSAAITLGHVVNVFNTRATKVFSKRILFVGVNNKINIGGINHFIEHVLPDVKKIHPDVKLVLAGRIYLSKDDVLDDDCIVYTGEYNEINEPYDQADIVVNPVLLGTGLKIKTVEAISYKMPLVSYKSGVEGLDNNVEHPYYLFSESDEQFKDNLIKLIEDAELRAELSKNCSDFIKKYNDECSSEFLRIIRNHNAN